MLNFKKTVLTSLILATSITTTTTTQAAESDMKFAGALEFSNSGTLFVGDNYNGAIYAFDMTDVSAPDKVAPIHLNHKPGQ